MYRGWGTQNLVDFLCRVCPWASQKSTVRQLHPAEMTASDIQIRQRRHWNDGRSLIGSGTIVMRKSRGSLVNKKCSYQHTLDPKWWETIHCYRPDQFAHPIWPCIWVKDHLESHGSEQTRKESSPSFSRLISLLGKKVYTQESESIRQVDSYLAQTVRLGLQWFVWTYEYSVVDAIPIGSQAGILLAYRR